MVMITEKSGSTRAVSVLLIEDDPAVVRRMQEMLSGAEGTTFHVEATPLLSSGLERLGQGDIDVLMLDLSLLDTQGLDVVGRLREKTPTLPVVILLTSKQRVAARTLVGLVDGYVVKESMNSSALELVIMQAISDGRKKEAAYVDRRFRALIENSTDGTLLVDAAAKVLYGSPGLRRILGYAEGETFGLSAFDFMHLDDLGIVVDLYNKVGSVPGTRVSAQVRVKHKDGSWLWVEGSATNYLHDPAVGAIVINFRDIAERKKAEETLTASEKRFRALIENSTDGIAVLALDGTVLYGSPSAARLLGYDEKEALGFSFSNFLHPDDVLPALNVISQIMQNQGASGVLEVRGKNKDGSWHWFEATATNRVDDPLVKGIVINIRDVTERKRSEEALYEREQRFKQLFTNVSDAVVFVDLTGKILDVNKRIEDVFGLSREEVVGRNFGELGNFSQETLAALASQIAQSITDQSARPIISAPVVHKDGHEIHIEVCTGVVNGAQGDLQGFVSVIRDVTERKRAEDALRESERRFRAIFDNPMNFVFIHDALGVFVDANDAALNRLGYTRDDLGRLSFFDVAYSDDVQEALDALGQTATKGFMDKPVQLRVRSKTGEVLWVEAYGYAIAHQGQYRGLTIAEDITERKGMEDELRQFAEALSDQNVQLEAARQELAELNQSLEQKVRERTADVEKLLKQKDQFISQLGHDLKSPLTPLVTLLPMLKDEIAEADRQEIVDAAITNVNFMRELVTKTLKLAKLTSVGTGPVTARAQMRRQLDAVLKGRKAVADKKLISIETLMDDEIAVQLEGIDLQELFDNIINNAIKFTPEGGRITIDAVLSEPFVTVAVKDTGVGMNEEQLSHLFEEFYKADPSRHDLDSSGLGLSICKRIVQRAGGKIWAESEGLGKGATFCFTLKLAEADSKPAQKEETWVRES